MTDAKRKPCIKVKRLYRKNGEEMENNFFLNNRNKPIYLQLSAFI